MKFIPIKCDCGGEFNATFTTRFGKIYPPLDCVFIDEEGNIQPVKNQILECNDCGKIIPPNEIDNFMNNWIKGLSNEDELA